MLRWFSFHHSRHQKWGQGMKNGFSPSPILESRGVGRLGWPGRPLAQRIEWCERGSWHVLRYHEPWKISEILLMSTTFPDMFNSTSPTRRKRKVGSPQRALDLRLVRMLETLPLFTYWLSLGRQQFYPTDGYSSTVEAPLNGTLERSWKSWERGFVSNSQRSVKELIELAITVYSKASLQVLFRQCSLIYDVTIRR